MANYHFRIKSDKKKNGSRISAATHTEYIDREGKFKNIDEKQLMSLAYQDCIFGKESEATERLPDKERVLYKSPFGIIKQDHNGIHISPNASPETIAIAVTLATNIYGKNLILTGEQQFQAKAIIAGSQLDLSIHFSDKEQEACLIKLKEKEKNEREQYAKNGTESRRKFKRSNRNRNIVAKLHKSGLATMPGKYSSSRRLSLSTLPTLPMGPGKNRKGYRTSGNMQSRIQNVHGNADIFEQRRGSHIYSRLRWLLSAGRRRVIADTAEKIMSRIQSVEDKIFAESHIQYINREASFRQRGGCIYKSHHLPYWAENSPKKFFAAADKYERANGERYKEIEFALPNELTLQQQKEIIDEFIQKHLSDYYYAYAVHSKIGAMSNGEHHPHVHIMFSTRKIDDYEKTSQRPADIFFKRENKNSPALGGCKKDEKWTDKNRSKFLLQLREDAAAIQNKILQKYKVPAKVDHRSLKSQRAEALREGNYYLAELLDRIPQSSVGPTALLEKENNELTKQRLLRQNNYQRQLKIFTKHYLNDTVRRNAYKSKNNTTQIKLMEIEQLFKDMTFPEEMYTYQFRNAIARLNQLNEQIKTEESLIKWNYDAFMQAQMDFMTQAEREIWLELRTMGKELREWQNYKQDCSALAVPDQKVIDGIDAQIINYRWKMRLLADRSRPIFKKYQKEPVYSKIQNHVGGILYENEFIKRKLERMNDQFTQKVNSLYSDLKALNSTQKTYTSEMILDSINDDIKTLKASLRSKKKELRTQQKKVISYERAIYIAKDIFTKREYKKIRDENKLLKKQFANGTYTIEIIFLLQQELAAKKDLLDKKCSGPAAQKKILEIATGILRKNAPEASKLKTIEKEVQKIENDVQVSEKRFAASSNDKQKNGSGNFKVTGTGSISTAKRDSRIIADALSGNSKYTQLVARSDGQQQTGLNNWTMLSEMEKSKRLAEEALKEI